MPSKKNRGTEGRNLKVPRVTEAMGLGRKGASPIHAATSEVRPVHDNLKKSGGKRGKGGGIKSTANYDVQTRVNLPSAKGAAKKSRISTKEGMK